MSIFLMYLVLGSVAGVLAGLLGIGGGLVIVPMLTFAFAAQGLDQVNILHMALGTSLASIIFTSISSLRAHHKRRAVIWPVVKRITPGILVGTFLGSWIASQLSTSFLKIFFGVFLLYVATQMILGIKPKASRNLPGNAGIFAARMLATADPELEKKLLQFKQDMAAGVVKKSALVQKKMADDGLI